MDTPLMSPTMVPWFQLWSQKDSRQIFYCNTAAGFFLACELVLWAWTGILEQKYCLCLGTVSEVSRGLWLSPGSGEEGDAFNGNCCFQVRCAWQTAQCLSFTAHCCFLHSALPSLPVFASTLCTDLLPSLIKFLVKEQRASWLLTQKPFNYKWIWEGQILHKLQIH